MLDPVFLSVRDTDLSIAFYEAAPASLGITSRHDYDGKDGPPGHPDLKDFGSNGRMFFWRRRGEPHASAAHVGFVARSIQTLDATYAAAMTAGAADKGCRAPGCTYDPRCYAANVLNPDGDSLEFVFKSWPYP